MTETELTEQPITDHAATAEVSATEVSATPFEAGQQAYYVDTKNVQVLPVNITEDRGTPYLPVLIEGDTENRIETVNRGSLFADEREAYSYAQTAIGKLKQELSQREDAISNWLWNRHNSERRAEWLATLQPLGPVYPSNEVTMWADPNDRYGGAHSYYLRHYIAFRDGKPTYSENLFGLQFNSKLDDGTPTEGVMSEQLLLILLDRHDKLNTVFPHATHDKFRRGLEMALEACRERVDDRVARGVMGELKV